MCLHNLFYTTLFISLLIVFWMFVVLFVLGWLKLSHDIRFVDGYDSELEADYHTMLHEVNRK